MTWRGVVSCGTVRLGLVWLIGVTWRGVVRMGSWLCGCVACGVWYVVCVVKMWLVAYGSGVWCVGLTVCGSPSVTRDRQKTRHDCGFQWFDRGFLRFDPWSWPGGCGLTRGLGLGVVV